MISAKVFVSFVESPGNGKTGDHAPEEIFRFMRTQYPCAGPIQVALTLWLIQLQQGVLPLFPMPDVVIAQVLIGLEQAGANLLACFCPHFAETKRKNKFTAASSEIYFSGQRNVAVLCACVLPGHLIILGEILPAIGCTR